MRKKINLHFCRQKKSSWQKPAGLIVFDCRYFYFVVVTDFSNVFYQRVLNFIVRCVCHIFAYFPGFAYRQAKIYPAVNTGCTENHLFRIVQPHVFVQQRADSVHFAFVYYEQIVLYPLLRADKHTFCITYRDVIIVYRFAVRWKIGWSFFHQLEKLPLIDVDIIDAYTIYCSAHSCPAFFIFFACFGHF